ncbi:hypothetical protein PS691_02445 [Pseudomonas fluorescens]|uniref:Isochorismatase-like domain-containing protein n=1 Tax=Pseudomonas fluorescens TaxID=294 RepID=A0A5E7C3I7_PSEFL|nr:hypothetical protein PS691_02445 [Pseudomonas fluorescens]
MRCSGIGKLTWVATARRHHRTPRRIHYPFQKQLGWHPAPDDNSLVEADRIFIKHGYAPSPDTIQYLKSLNVDRVLVCGLQTETCCLGPFSGPIPTYSSYLEKKTEFLRVVIVFCLGPIE